LESVAYEYAYYLKILQDQLPGLDLFETRAVGGGAHSDLWNQMKADVLGVPYQRLQRSELGTWGAAMIAGRAVEVYADLAATVEQSTPVEDRPFQPDPANHKIYEGLVQRYIGLESSLAQFYQ
jgi:xylulokinase